VITIDVLSYNLSGLFLCDIIDLAVTFSRHIVTFNCRNCVE